MAIYDTPMRRPRCFVFDLPLKLRSSNTSKPKRKIRLFIYVCVLPTSLPSGGFQHDYDATKIGKIIQTAKFFFGKVLEGVQNYLRVLLSPPHIKLPKVSGFKDESVKIILLSRCAKLFL